jgi:hypothetical protein
MLLKIKGLDIGGARGRQGKRQFVIGSGCPGEAGLSAPEGVLRKLRRTP